MTKILFSLIWKFGEINKLYYNTTMLQDAVPAVMYKNTVVLRTHDTQCNRNCC
jgi:hypothetical protein